MACNFRRLDEGLGGPKNKRKRSEPEQETHSQPESMELDDAETNPPSSKRQALPSSDDPSKPSYGHPTYDGTIAGKVSGRTWKHVRTQRASATRVSRQAKTLELRNKEMEIKRGFRERVNELKEEIRANKVEKRRKREEREKKKKENVLKSGTKLQKITNPKTLKKIVKSKERKLLKVVPDDLAGLGARRGARRRRDGLLA